MKIYSNKITDTKIQTCSIENLAEIYQIESDSCPYHWSYQVMSDTLSDKYLCYGLRKDNILCGFVILQYILDEIQILNIRIATHYQNLGFATNLLKFIINFAQKHNIKKLFLEVRKSNKNAIKLYTKQGFIPIAVRKKYYKNTDNTKEDAIIMQLILAHHLA